MASNLTSVSPIPTAPQAVSTAPANMQLSPQFGAVADTVQFSGRKDDDDATEREQGDKPSIKERLGAAATDAMNTRLIMQDALWATLFTTIISLGMLPFSWPVIPSVMAASAGYRAIMGLIRGTPAYAEEGFSLSRLIKRNKNKAEAEDAE